MGVEERAEKPCYCTYADYGSTEVLLPESLAECPRHGLECSVCHGDGGVPLGEGIPATDIAGKPMDHDRCPGCGGSGLLPLDD